MFALKTEEKITLACVPWLKQVRCMHIHSQVRAVVEGSWERRKHRASS